MLELISAWGSIKMLLAAIWTVGLVQTVVWTFAYVYVFWIGFGLMMSLQRARDANQLTTPAKVLGYPLLAIFIVMDFLFNFIICTVVFLEWPKIIVFTKDWKPLINNEWLATQRIERYMYRTEIPTRPESSNQWLKLILFTHFLNSWRITAAKWLAGNLIDPLAPNGRHCKP